MPKKININIEGLLPKQEEIINSILDGPWKYHMIRAGRKGGKTYVAIYLSMIWALSKPNTSIAFVNYENKPNQEVFDILMSLLPAEVILSSLRNDKDRNIQFINGSKIKFFTAKNPGAIVSFSFDYLIADEHALWKTEAWYFIQPIVLARKNAKVVLASTTRGKNHFYDLCIKGRGDDNFHKEFTLSYQDNPHIDLREIDMQRDMLPPTIFRQEYLGEFVFGQGEVFGNFENLQTIKEWAVPDPSKRYFFGIDFAGTGFDKTVLTIMDEHGNIVYIYECQNDRVPDQVHELYREIIKWSATGYGESNGLGAGLVEGLQDRGIHIKKFFMSNDGKAELVSKALKDIAEASVHFPTVELCSKLDNEMSTYTVGKTPTGKLSYSHDKGLHDDYVDSFLIANHARHKFLYSGFELFPESRLKTPKDSPIPAEASLRPDAPKVFHGQSYTDAYK